MLNTNLKVFKKLKINQKIRQERDLERVLWAPGLERALERALWAPGQEQAQKRALWAPGLERAL